MPVLKNRRGDIFIPFREGHKWVHAVVLDTPPVRVERLTHDEEVNLLPAQYKGGPYPIKRACERLLAFGEQVGITEAARRALKELAAREVD